MRVAPCRSLNLKNREILLFKGRPGLSLCEGRAIQKQSIWCVGLSCRSRLSNQTAEKNQKDQMNQLPAPRREMLDCKS